MPFLVVKLEGGKLWQSPQTTVDMFQVGLGLISLLFGLWQYTVHVLLALILPPRDRFVKFMSIAALVLWPVCVPESALVPWQVAQL